jgi:hypothetical protein
MNKCLDMDFIKPEQERDRSHVSIKHVRHISDLLMHIHFKYEVHTSFDLSFYTAPIRVTTEWHLKNGWRWPAKEVQSGPRQANCLAILVLDSRTFILQKTWVTFRIIGTNGSEEFVRYRPHSENVFIFARKFAWAELLPGIFRYKADSCSR